MMMIMMMKLTLQRSVELRNWIIGHLREAHASSILAQIVVCNAPEQDSPLEIVVTEVLRLTAFRHKTSSGNY